MAKRKSEHGNHPAPTSAQGLREAAIRRAFISGAGAKLIGAVLSLVTVGIQARILGSEEFGLLSVFVGFGFIALYLDFGVGSALVSPLARAYQNRDDKAISLLIARSLALLCIVGVSVAIAGLVVAGWLRESSASHAASVLAFAAGLSISIPVSMATHVAMGLHKGYLTNLVYLGSVLAVLGGTGLLSSAGAPLPWYVLLISAAPAVGNLVLLVAVARPYFRDRLSLREIMHLGAISSRLKDGLPHLLYLVSMAIVFHAGTAIVAASESLDSAAAYSLALRIYLAVYPLLGAGLQQMWGAIAHAESEGDFRWIVATFRGIVIRSSLAFAAVALAITLTAPYVTELWVGDHIELDPVMMVTFGIWHTYYFTLTQFNYLLNGLGKVWIQVPSAITAAVAFVAFGGMATERLGAIGPVVLALILHVATLGWLQVALSVFVLRSSLGKTK